MNLKIELGKNIQKYRKLNKITQEKLAEMIDVEINSISSFERGKYFPSPDNILKISKALNVSLPELFTFSERCTVDDYKNEIFKNIDLLGDNKEKLHLISVFVKNILFD